jgi:ABC-type transporter Mla subunit MlaD
MIKHLISIFLLSFLFALISCDTDKQNNLLVKFDRVDFLQPGAKVYKGGMPVGEVENLELVVDSILVTLKLDPQINIPVGSEFIISPSITADAFITIEPVFNARYLTDGDTAIGYYNATTKLNDIIADSAQRAKADKAINKIGEGVKELLEAAKDSIK